jgi:DNA-binding MarR family transcriptional regulator
VAHPRWLDTEEKRAWNAFLSSHALLSRRLDRQLKREAGISHLQYEILTKLSASPNREMRMAELACGLINTKSGLTYQVGQLELAGFVRRRPCPSDSRAVYAGLTDKGMAFLARIAPAHVALVRDLLIDVLTPEQLSTIADGLGEASRRMQQTDPHDVPSVPEEPCGGG